MRREASSTTVTVTRVVGAPSEPGEEPVPDVVVVQTQEPEKDTTTVKLIRLVLSVSVVTLGILVGTVTFRVLRHEMRQRAGARIYHG